MVRSNNYPGPKRKGGQTKRKGGQRKKASTSSFKGKQLDPGIKRRSGGYIASSPSLPAPPIGSGGPIKNPRGKNLEYKHEARKRTTRKAQQAGTVYSKAFFAVTVDAMAHNAKNKKSPNPGDVKSKGSVMSHGTRWGPAVPTTMPYRKYP